MSSGDVTYAGLSTESWVWRKSLFKGNWGLQAMQQEAWSN